MRSNYDRRNTTTRHPLSDNIHFKRVAGSNEVVQNLIRNGFVENAFVAKIKEVVFQRLEFNAGFVGNVLHGNCAKIRQPCFGADRGKFGVCMGDSVASPIWCGVWECFNWCHWRIQESKTVQYCGMENLQDTKILRHFE